MDDNKVYLGRAYVLDLNASKDNRESLLKPFEGINVQLEEVLISIMYYLGANVDEMDGPELYMTGVYAVFNQLIGSCLGKGYDCISIVFEEFYVDRVYRSSYYYHYSSKHFDVSRHCLRLFLFAGDINRYNYENDYTEAMNEKLEECFIGFMTLTPNQGCTLSRSIFSPKYLIKEDLKDVMIRLAEYTCHMYGRRLKIQGFPYLEQDADTITCAEVTVLLLSDYFSQMYQEFRVATPSDILELINQYDPQRVTPSHGIKYDILAKILKDLGFFPLLITAQEIQRNVQVDAKFLLHSYLDSCLPVAVHVHDNRKQNEVNHSVLCIGYGEKNIDRIKTRIKIKATVGIEKTFSKDESRFERLYYIESSQLFDSYYVMDDNRTPYIKLKYGEQKASDNGFTGCTIPTLDEKYIQNMVVPLNRGMTMKASDALTIFTSFLAGTCGITYIISNCFEEDKKAEILESIGCKKYVPGKDEEEPLIIRVFLASSKSFKDKRIKTLCTNAAAIYSEVPLPRFVWICELYSISSYLEGKVIGEILLDATSASVDRERSLIMCHYPNMIVYRYPNEDYSGNFWSGKINNPERIDGWVPFDSFEFGHTSKAITPMKS